MKAGKMAIQPWLSCQYTENMLMDLPSSVFTVIMYLTGLNGSVRLSNKGVTNRDMLLNEMCSVWY